MPWGLYCQKLQDKNERERAVQGYLTEGGCCAVHISDTVLSVVHLSTQASHLQIHSDLFSICFGGFPQVRAFQGTVSYCAQTAALPSLGRERVRSCALSNPLFSYYGKWCCGRDFSENLLKQHKKQQNLQLGDALFGRHLHSQNYSICLRLLLYVQIQSPNAAKNKAPSDDGALFFATFGDGANSLPRSLCLGALPLLYLRISGCEILKYRLRRYSLCLGALPLLYPGAASPSVFAYGKYTAPAVALVREYVVDFYANLLMTGQKGTSEFSLGIGG